MSRSIPATPAVASMAATSTSAATNGYTSSGSGSGPSHLQPAHVVTHPASNTYLYSLYAAAGLSLAAAAAYAAYRYYAAHPSAAPATPATHAGAHDKRAPYPVVEVTDDASFDAALAAANAAKPPGATVFVLVEGAKEGPGGVSWCGDCVAAEPVVERVFGEAKERVSLVRAEVGRAAYKGNMAHPYRVHPQLQLQRIPTLYRMRGVQVDDQLIEQELHDVDKVRKFVNKQ